MTERPLRVLLVHPGASWSTADVEAGLRYGLTTLGVEVSSYRLDLRIDDAAKELAIRWRRMRKSDPSLAKPEYEHLLYHASIGVLEVVLRTHVDVVLIVSGMYFHPNVVAMLKQAGKFVTVLLTESPYDHHGEKKFAALADGCWTNERSVVADLRTVTRNVGYLPHAWHPLVHGAQLPMAEDVPAHDVVFVGSGFPERIEFFNAINWEGIDLGLYGHWRGGLNKHVRKMVKQGPVSNAFASALYRKAKIGLSLYRHLDQNGQPVFGESLSPRAYELAACGAFHLSEFRREVPEVFGTSVPTFRTPTEAAALIRLWLADPAGRSRLAAQLPACVAEATWIARAKTVLGDLQARLHIPGRELAARSA